MLFISRFVEYAKDVLAGAANDIMDADGELRQRSYELAFDPTLSQGERDAAYLAGLDIGVHDLYGRKVIESDPKGKKNI